MAENHAPTPSNGIAPNLVTVQRTQDTHMLDVQATEGKYMLSHGIRVVVVVTSACLSACGLALIVLGAVGSSGKFIQGLGGLNAVVTGVTMLLAGSIGCVAFIQSKEKSVGRMLLICVVVMCHISGAFAVQCVIISGQLIGRYQAESCDVITPSGTGMDSDVVPYCPRDTSLLIAACILPLSILGFLLGVACSASCYFAAPRLLCCLSDINQTPRKHIPNQPQVGESRAILAPRQMPTDV